MAQIQVYSDGILQLYKACDAAEEGNAPDIRHKPMGKMWYQSRTVGVSRYYQAMQNNVKADLLVRIPKRKGLTTNDMVTIGKTRYAIKQIQYPVDVIPPSMDLTLEAVEP